MAEGGSWTEGSVVVLGGVGKQLIALFWTQVHAVRLEMKPADLWSILDLLQKEIFSTFSMLIPNLTAIGKQRPNNNMAMNCGEKPVSTIRILKKFTISKIKRGE